MKMMKRIVPKYIAVLLSVLLSVSALFSTGAALAQTTPEEKEISEVNLLYLPEKLTYEYGEELDLTGALVGVVYADNTGRVVQPEELTVQGYDPLKPGKQRVYLIWGEHMVYYDVTVNERQGETLTLSAETLSVRVGKTVSLTANLEGCTFASDNAKIAAVDQNGVIQGIAGGSAVITATAPDGQKAFCTVTVTAPADAVSLSHKSKALYVGKTYRLTASMLPEGVNDTLKWSSSDTSIVKVSQKGTIKGIQPGTATVTVTTGSGKKASCKVTVKSLPCTGIKLNKTTLRMNAGLTIRLYATLSPAGCGETVVWSSSNEKICKVDANGAVTGVGAGVAKITAKCGGKAASCNVTVIGYTPGAFTISYVKVQSKPNCYALKIENPSANLITIYPTKAKIYDKTKKAYAVTQICGNDLKPAKKVSIGNGVGAVGFYSDFELTGSKYERVLFRFKYSGKWYQGLYSVKYGFTYKEL